MSTGTIWSSAAALFRRPNQGKFTRIEGQVRFTFGPHRGQPLEQVAAREPGFLEWMLRADFADDVKALVRDALSRRRMPVPTLRPKVIPLDGSLPPDV
jgi:hypothetical protein